MKRQIAIRYDKLVKKQKVLAVILEYRDTKEELEINMKEPDFPERLKTSYQEILRKEQAAIAAGNVSFLRSLNKRLGEIGWEYRRNSVAHARSLYLYYKLRSPSHYKDITEVSRLTEIGDEMLTRESTTAKEIMTIVSHLWNLLEDQYKRDPEDSDFQLKGTGLR